MKISEDNISFQSKIKFIDSRVFKEKVKYLNPKRHKVGYPWTPETHKKGKNIYTDEVMDCIYVGVVNKNKVDVYHLCTRNQAAAKRTRQKGFSVKEFKRRLLESNSEGKDRHALVLGGFQSEGKCKGNEKKLNQITDVLTDVKIPYSIFGARKDVHYYGRYSVLYENKNDTFYITNSLTTSRSLNGKNQEVIVKGKEVEFNEYQKPLYKTVRRKTDVEGYMNNQFKYVKLSEFDEWA